MVIDTKEKTALATSVGADERQSVQITDNIIPTSNAEFNDLNENSTESLEEMYRQMRRFADPYYLHTVSLTELYQTAYKSRPPLIDGLLYSGAYILAGAPKIGKSFLVAQIAYHVSTGERLWEYEVHQGVGTLPCPGGRLPANPKPYVYDVRRGGQQQSLLRNGGKQNWKRA